MVCQKNAVMLIIISGVNIEKQRNDADQNMVSFKSGLFSE